MTVTCFVVSLRTNVSYFGGFVVRICRAVSTFSFTSIQGSSHILGYVATVKFNELTDIVILICYSFSLFTHYIWLLIRWSGVRAPADPPAFTTYYFSGIKCYWSNCCNFVALTGKVKSTFKALYFQNPSRQVHKYQGIEVF